VTFAECVPSSNKGDRSYEMNAIGDYHNVARFLAEIASLPRIVTPVELTVEPFQQPTLYPELEAPVLASFRIETYVLPEAAPVPPPAAGGE